MKKLLFLFTLFFIVARLQAQTAEPLDTVYLMSGKTVTGIVKDSADEQLKILTPKKNNEFKADFIDLDLVYSVKYRNGAEIVFYKQDTLFGNYFTPREVQYFIYGERDAMKYYHCRLWCAGGFAAGFAGGYYQGFATTLLPPFAYAFGTTMFRVKIKPGTVSRPDYLKYDTYVLGYEKDARKRRVFRTMMWAGIGTAAGFVTSSIVQAQKP